MKKKSSLILVGVCALALALFAIPAFAMPSGQGAHNAWFPEKQTYQQHFVDENNDGVCDHAKSWYCQQCQKSYVDEDENGVCDHYEAGECVGVCDGTGCEYGAGNGYGCGNGYGNCDGSGNGCGNGNCNGNGNGCGHGKHCNW